MPPVEDRTKSLQIWVFSPLIAHSIVVNQNTPTSLRKLLYEPITIRLPKNGETYLWSGLPRPALNDLILPSERNNFSPPVRSKALKSPKNSQGIRLHMKTLTS